MYVYIYIYIYNVYIYIYIHVYIYIYRDISQTDISLRIRPSRVEFNAANALHYRCGLAGILPNKAKQVHKLTTRRALNRGPLKIPMMLFCCATCTYNTYVCIYVYIYIYIYRERERFVALGLEQR